MHMSGCPFVPARAVLVDFHPPMDTSTCLNIQEALSSTLTLLHHVAGPCRLPFFSLIVLGNYPEVLGNEYAYVVSYELQTLFFFCC